MSKTNDQSGLNSAVCSKNIVETSDMPTMGSTQNIIQKCFLQCLGRGVEK